MTNYTHQDVTHLAGIIRGRKRENRAFALMIGAGCSKAAGIPLASELIAEINERYPAQVTRLSEEEKKDYGQCMGGLPLNQRRELLDPYLRDAKLNWAHIAIASLISAGYVQRVLTVNFDNVLARACGLCGIYPATYDYATGASSSTVHIASPAIIHLHGQGSGARLINDTEEAEKQATSLAQLLQQTLEKYPLLVVGYSGLCDSLFDQLKNIYKGYESLHWCSYTSEPGAHILTLSPERQVDHYGGVDADEFLISLAQTLECFPPTVFSDPLNHLRHEIADVLPFPLQGEGGEVDILSQMQSRLNKYEQLEENDKGKSALVTRYPLTQRLLAGKTEEIIAAYENGESPLTDDTRENLATAYFQQAFKSENYQEKVQLNQQAVAIKPDYHQAFNNWGVALFNLRSVC